jgi:hypothetical protein
MLLNHILEAVEAVSVLVLEVVWSTFLKVAFQETRFEILVVVVKTFLFGLIQKGCFPVHGQPPGPQSLTWKSEFWKARFWATQIERDLRTRTVAPELGKIRTLCDASQLSQQIIWTQCSSNHDGGQHHSLVIVSYERQHCRISQLPVRSEFDYMRNIQNQDLDIATLLKEQSRESVPF